MDRSRNLFERAHRIFRAIGECCAFEFPIHDDQAKSGGTAIISEHSDISIGHLLIVRETTTHMRTNASTPHFGTASGLIDLPPVAPHQLWTPYKSSAAWQGRSIRGGQVCLHRKVRANYLRHVIEPEALGQANVIC